MNDKQQLAAMGEHMAEQTEKAGQAHPLCMAKRIEELEAQVRVMVGLLRELRECAEFEVADGELAADTVELIDAALACKLPAPAASAVPDGWKLVPVEPTIQMLAAFVEAGGKAISGYQAMLAAAPKPDAAK